MLRTKQYGIHKNWKSRRISRCEYGLTECTYEEQENIPDAGCRNLFEFTSGRIIN